jgi:nucleotide-binding universal stress UspA family protein
MHKEVQTMAVEVTATPGGVDVPMQVRRIVVPLDGSMRAESALPYAIKLATTTDASLLLVRVANTHQAIGAGAAEAQSHAIERAETYVTRLLATTPMPSVAVETAIPYGDPVDGIAQAVARHEADLIVMATHGRSGISRAVLGSVSEGLLAATSVPLLLLRDGLSYVTWESGLRSILVPLDGSVESEQALPIGQALAQLTGARLTLFRAVPAEETDFKADGLLGDGEPDSERASARAYLAEIAQTLRPTDGARDDAPEIQTVVGQGSAAAEICRACELTEAALVVMATHGRTGLRRAVMGSVADEVIRKGSVPVLLARAGSLGR